MGVSNHLLSLLNYKAVNNSNRPQRPAPRNVTQCQTRHLRPQLRQSPRLQIPRMPFDMVTYASETQPFAFTPSVTATQCGSSTPFACTSPQVKRTNCALRFFTLVPSPSPSRALPSCAAAILPPGPPWLSAPFTHLSHPAHLNALAPFSSALVPPTRMTERLLRRLLP